MASVTLLTDESEIGANLRVCSDALQFQGRGNARRYTDEDIFVRLVRIREGAIAESGGSPKPDFEVFASGRVGNRAKQSNDEPYRQLQPSADDENLSRI